MPLTYDLPGKTLLLHNRLGIRIELNFDKLGLLELWISPLSGRSLDADVRNFSNRDDHTRLFDRIQLPGLSEAAFVRCDYDAFHTVVHFKHQVLHVVPLFDRPGLVLWFEQPQTVDFKSDKADTPRRRDDRHFLLEHPDRGLVFHFAAALEPAARFVHQIRVEPGRSTYAQARLPAGERLCVCGGLADENVLALARDTLRPTLQRFLDSEARLIANATSTGAFQLRAQPKLQSLLDVNRRVLVSMQDTSGAVRAALNRIYYLIWVRDGAIIEVMHGNSGSLEPLQRWTDFLLANPTVIRDESPRGRTFLMLVNPITKWEEDGIFYAIWSAFSAWTQSGDDARYRSPDTLAVLHDALDWLERRCFDRRRGLFGRFFACETPLPGSRDDGYDNAVGNPTGPSHVRHDGVPARQSFDIYINLYAYAAYGMLAALETNDTKAQSLLRKAQRLGRRIARFFPDNQLPDYGDILGADGKTRRAGPFGLDLTDYVWGLSLTPYTPHPWRMHDIRRRLLQRAVAKPANWFLAGYFSLLSSLDTDATDESEILHAMHLAAKQCYRPGRHLAMPNTVVEMFDQPDGHPWHDVRPQAFSIGPWLATVCGLGLRRLPHGLAVRAGRNLKHISNYEYRRCRLTATFSGTGDHLDIQLDGQPLRNSLQIPDDRLPIDDVATLTVRRVRKPAPGPLLVASTVRLESLSASAPDQPTYHLTAYGLNTLEFRGTGRFTLRNLAGKSVPLQTHRTSDRTFLTFAGRGPFTLHSHPQ